MSAAASTVKLLALITKSVPSPSIFSPSFPNVSPTPEGTLISVVAVKLISLPELIVKSKLITKLLINYKRLN